jgi:hypothetical protein
LLSFSASRNGNEFPVEKKYSGRSRCQAAAACLASNP